MSRTNRLIVALLLPEKHLAQQRLCATSVFSVSLWLFFRPIEQPPRHREHRDCTEKRRFSSFRAKLVGLLLPALLLGAGCKRMITTQGAVIDSARGISRAIQISAPGI